MAIGRAPARRRLLRAFVALCYLLTLGVILSWPARLERLVDTVFETLSRAVPAVSGARIDLLLNVVFFVPFGMILARVMPRRPWRILPVAWVGPLLIEIDRGVFLPGRVSSAIDVATTPAGGLTGAASVRVLRRRLTRRNTRRDR